MHFGLCMEMSYLAPIFCHLTGTEMTVPFEIQPPSGHFLHVIFLVTDPKLLPSPNAD